MFGMQRRHMSRRIWGQGNFSFSPKASRPQTWLGNCGVFFWLAALLQGQLFKACFDFEHAFQHSNLIWSLDL